MQRKLREVPLVLASASPRRRRLMAALPWRALVRPSRAHEPEPPFGTDPRAWAVSLARKKARETARRLEAGLVLGADTIVYRAGRIFNKPRSPADARRMLGRLAGRWHRVYTGVALAARPGRRVWTAVRVTRVRMRALSERELDFWSRRNHDKAGGYAAQAKGSRFVERYDGDFDNVVGLPMRDVRALLRKARKAGFRPK